MQPADMRLLLDAEGMRSSFARIRSLRGYRIETVSLASAWIKPGRHFNTHYVLESAGSGGEKVRVSAFLPASYRRALRAIGAGASHRDDVAPAACAHCASVLLDSGVLLQIFPWDYRLPTLAICLDCEQVAGRLPVSAPLRDAAVAAYRPGMRCQILYRSADGSRMFGKVAAESTPGRAFALLRRVWSGQTKFFSPRPLGYDADLRLTVAAEVQGGSLHERLEAGPIAPAAAGSLADALAAFHQLPLDGSDKVHRPADELGLVRDWVALVSSLYPQWEAELDSAVVELERELPRATTKPSLVHRDFHDKQVLLGADLPAFLDLDTACAGDPEIDLGNFTAHMTLRELQWDRRGNCAAFGLALLEAFPKPANRSRLAWYRRATLLRLACVYALRPAWRHLTPALIGAARSR